MFTLDEATQQCKRTRQPQGCSLMIAETIQHTETRDKYVIVVHDDRALFDRVATTPEGVRIATMFWDTL